MSLEQKAWEFLDGEENDGVTPQKLLSFLAAVMNISLSQQCDIKKCDKYSNIEIQKIHKEYNEYYINKKASNIANTNQNKENGLTFAPKLCENSIKMASTMRISGLEDHATTLIKQKDIQEKYILKNDE